jgi:hypothetical protein
MGGMSHVGLYLEWDLSHFIYLFIFFLICLWPLTCVWAIAFSFLFFLIILVLLSWGLMKLTPFKLLIF